MAGLWRERALAVGLKLYTFQQLHENIQEEIHSTHEFFLVLEKLVLYTYTHIHVLAYFISYKKL